MNLTGAELRIASALVQGALLNGYAVSVYDGEEYALKRSKDAAAILEAMGATEADTLTFRTADGLRVGFVLLVYGNGEDVIADHSADGPIAALAESTY